MGWTWQYEDGDGGVLTAPVAETFATKGDAETWIGEQWRELHGRGVHQVTLLEDGRVDYGPMGLDAE